MVQRCSWHELVAPGGELTSVQCRNTGTHFDHIDGCGCSDPDWEVCEKGLEVWVCDGPCDFPKVE